LARTPPARAQAEGCRHCCGLEVGALSDWRRAEVAVSWSKCRHAAGESVRTVIVDPPLHDRHHDAAPVHVVGDRDAELSQHTAGPPTVWQR
jgi:hypothetical protein